MIQNKQVWDHIEDSSKMDGSETETKNTSISEDYESDDSYASEFSQSVKVLKLRTLLQHAQNTQFSLNQADNCGKFRALVLANRNVPAKYYVVLIDTELCNQDTKDLKHRNEICFIWR